MSAHAKFWTPVEDEIVSDLSMTAREAANQLPNRTECAVKVRRTSKGLNRIATRKKWSAEEVEYVLSHGEMTDDEKDFGA